MLSQHLPFQTVTDPHGPEENAGGKVMTSPDLLVTNLLLSTLSTLFSPRLHSHPAQTLKGKKSASLHAPLVCFKLNNKSPVVSSTQQGRAAPFVALAPMPANPHPQGSRHLRDSPGWAHPTSRRLAMSTGRAWKPQRRSSVTAYG